MLLQKKENVAKKLLDRFTKKQKRFDIFAKKILKCSTKKRI